MKAGRFVNKWMPVIVWIAVIFAGSTDALSAEHTSRFLVPFLRWLNPQIAPAVIEQINFALRKIGHFSEYAILTGLLWRALRATFLSLGKGTLAVATFLLAAGFAASDEFHQSFVPTRTASLHDVLLDCGGALCVVVLCALLSGGASHGAGARLRVGPQ